MYIFIIIIIIIKTNYYYFLHIIYHDTEIYIFYFKQFFFLSRYAVTTFWARNLSPKPRFHHWVYVIVAEMTFLGLTVTMELIVVSDMDDYWRIDEDFNMHFFRTVLKRQTFCLILSFLHLCKNDKQPDHDHLDFDPIYKIPSFIKKQCENSHSFLNWAKTLQGMRP